MAINPAELQLRIIGAVSSIDDPAVLETLQRMIDRYRSGLRVLDEKDLDSILGDLRPAKGDD